LRIVLTNDDGIDAPGIETLERVLRAIRPNAELVVVAPDGPRSGIGHALAHTGVHIETADRGEGRIAVDGTPADCTRLALARGGPLWPGTDPAHPRPVDWVVSGINHGANLGTDTFVSGTAAAAREAALLGTPAIAISQYQARHRHIDWAHTLERARDVLDALLDRPPALPAYWNVNLPHPTDERMRPDWQICPIDPSPLPVEFEANGRGYLNRADYHGRARRAGGDVDVCLGGRIAVSEVHPG
jgi:5'-nucleotidase